jgi:ABC-type sugar transport system substrate-binding protein
MKDRWRSARSRARSVRAAAVAVALLGGMAGCSTAASTSTTSDAPTSSSSGVSASPGVSAGALAQAKAIVAEFTKQPTAIPVTTPITKPVPSGKRIDFLTCQSQGCVTIADGFEQAAKVLGWQVKVLTVQATASAILDAYDEAIRDAPNGIVVVAVSTSGVAQQDQELIHMKIPVVAFQNPDEPTPPYIASLLNHNTSIPEGKDFAALAVANGCTNILYFQLGGFLVLQYNYQGFAPEYKALDPQGSVKVVAVPSTSLANAAPIIVSAARANPQANCLLLSQDDMTIGLPQALKAAGVSGMKIINEGPASPISDQYVKDGEVTATLLAPQLGDWGYLAADALARYFTGQSAAPDTNAVLVPWITTATSIPPVNGFAEVNGTQQEYAKLWGK